METNKILIVDDEEAFLFGFSKMLQSPDTTVDTAQTAASAKSLIKSTHYKVIISDLMLSNSTFLDGFEIIKYAKEIQPESRIIVLTAYSGKDTIEKVRELGANFCFVKPVSPTMIKEVIETS